MGKKTEAALAAIKGALEEQSAELSRHDSRLDRLEKIVETQAREIAALEDNVMAMRNGSIRAAIDRGVPTNVVAKAHGLTSGRVSQIAPRTRQPRC